ncbi:Glutaredoxin [Handroanthus impetiginosus]|uniref:Glutaredoxin n=1 Tax=Handroanthus impetiginosus TaxID=429701 RepID=A0A2G9G8W5_9LAMI|nr:Glutaredoxin [Handroanthus impetiginosus]
MVEKDLTSNSDDQIISEFEERCPPGGRDSVILYTTSLRGIRKTFEDCNTIKFLLESFRVKYSERDVSMHLEYREELWKVLGGKKVPPRLFIRGKYIGGADEVVGLHEKGSLKDLLRGITLTTSNYSCRGCGGMRFVVCCSCNGSRKVMSEGRNDGLPMRCPDCNENGLVKCSICS